MSIKNITITGNKAPLVIGSGNVSQNSQNGWFRDIGFTLTVGHLVYNTGRVIYDYLYKDSDVEVITPDHLPEEVEFSE